MDQYFLLNSRKRAIIALIHVVFFLLVALGGLAGSPKGAIFAAHGNVRNAALAMLAIYLIVSSLLLYLLGKSRCLKERLYFGFCTSSAALSIMRALLGESPLRTAQCLKVLMLACAGVISVAIWRAHAEVRVGD